ncbi:unnamed protein product [Rotaria sordida]|uniref:Methionine--tRNA ligase, cytoplasmic n=1 Tax=Rotaria sordida TaxID=392033 RepID=A0A818N8G3_9BILA|nr:unnamed protein product [Rotaria sordida]
MTTENISPLSSTSKIYHRQNKFKKNSENTSPTNVNDWTITFCIIGSACSNKRLLSSLEDRYVYECIHDEREVIRTLTETKILLSQRQLRIYIVDSFDDSIFQYLKDNENIYTISSELVLSCAEKEINIPVPRRNRPLYCQHLSSVTELSDFVHYLGGSVRKDYSDQVTHVISHANIGEKYLTAFNMERSEILTEEWLLRCWHERNNRQFNPFDSELIRIYRAKPLHNLNLFFFGFNNDNELQHLHTLTNEHGGFITKEMNEATHIVLSDINLFILTYPSYTRKHRQYIVHVQWFWECLCLMGKADESMYIVNLTSNQSTTPDSSLLLLSPSIHGDSPLHDSSLNTTIKRKRRHKHSYINEQIDNTPNSKRFNSSINENENLLDDNIVIEKQQNIKKDNKYLIGMELRETERNYVTMLSNIIRIFKTEMEKDDRRNGPILTKVESTQIFGNIEEIYHLHLSIAEQLDRAINEDECISSIFLTNSVELLRVYQPYTKFYDKTIEAIHTLEKTNPRFYAYLKICEHKIELGKQHLADLMIRPIQRLPSILLLLERLLKYTSITHIDYQLLIDSLDKLREIAKKLNEERGKTEKHLSMFNIVNSIDNCPPELLAAHRDYIEKFHVIELSQELTTTRTHLILFLFSDCLEVTKLRVNMWKTPGMKTSKTYKHIALIQLSDIRSLFDINSLSLTIDETEQFGILCSIDGQIRQLIFRVINGNTNTSTNNSKSYFTDSMSPSSSISTLSNSTTHHGNTKIDVLYHLSKAISDDRCLLDKSSLIQTVTNSNNNHHMYCSQTSLENSEIDSGLRSTSSLNLLGLALKRGFHKANKRLSRAFSFSPEPNKHLSKKINSPIHLLQDEWSNTFDSNKRMSVSSRQIMATSDNTDDINLQNLKVEESTTPKSEATSGAASTDKAAKSKKEKPKQEKPKQEKPKQEKSKQEKPQATAEAPVEELDFNRSQEEVVQALDQWSKKPSTLNKPKPDEKITPKSDARNIMITSALPYVNNVPHLGNLIGSLLSADVFARYCRLRNYNTLYICGTDEYGTATETKALEEKCTPREICDKYYDLHTNIYKWFQLDFDFFGRTSTKKQTEIAQDIFWKLHKRNLIFNQSVEQLYCDSCQRFLADRYVAGICPDLACKFIDARGDQCDKCGKLINAVDLIDPKCQICRSTPEIRKSEHLFLDLPTLSSDVQSWFQKSSTTGHWTNTATAITEAWLNEGLKPRCITRDLKWGTPVPLEGYTDKVFYVWFDAPIGYISIAANYTDDWEQWWKQPNKIELFQFMAKDNVPFHSVIFPACLLGTQDNYTIVNHLSGIDYLNYEDSKFSKSRGVGVFGDHAQHTEIPSDIWRFYLLYVRPETQDSVFSWADLMSKNNSELLNNLGNFINRAIAFCEKNLAGKISDVNQLETQLDQLFVAQITYELNAYLEVMEKTRLRDGVKCVLRMSRYGNQYLQLKQPWAKYKGSDADRRDAEISIALALNLVYLLSLVLQPFMPTTSDEIRQQLNINESVYALENAFRCYLPAGHTIGQAKPLFKRIEKALAEEYRLRFAGQKK